MAINVGSNLDFQGVLTAQGLVDPPPVPSAAVPLSYLNTQLAGYLQNPQAFDASGNPAAAPVGDIGETFNVTVAGTVGTPPITVGVGDLIIKTGAGTTNADIIVLRSSFPVATETEAGIIRLATSAEVAAGVVTDAAITPSTLDEALDARNDVLVLDASTNPDYPAATEGQLIYISAAGLIGGAGGIAVEEGDTVYAIIDSSGGDQVLAGADYNIVNTNIPAGGTGLQKFTATIGDGTAQSFTVNHNLGTTDVVRVQVIDTTTDIEWLTCVTITDANNVTVDFDIVPTVGQFKIVVAG